MSLVAPDTSPAHLESLWPAAGEAPLYVYHTHIYIYIKFHRGGNVNGISLSNIELHFVS